MSDNEQPKDPFSAFESDRTVIKPSAGRAARAGAAPGAAPAVAAVAGGPTAGRPALADVPMPELPAHASLNPLVQAAAPLLSAAPRLRATLRHPDPVALRAQLVESVKRFESVARAQGLPNEQVVAARYILCTLLDESASSTPWGGSGAWSSQSLLVHFHNEAWGGEKVFQLLPRLIENPTQHRNLLELIYAALSLGFEGRYKVLNDGKAQLESLRQRLAAKLRELAGPAERDLSPQWQGVAAAPARLSDGVPLWAVAAVLAGVLLALFLLLRLTLNAQTDATFTALQTIDAKVLAAPPAPPSATPAAAPPPRLAQLLRSDIDAGAVEVKDLADRSVVTLRGDGIFNPGSADVSGKARPLFERIGAALNRVPGPVLIAGHTDNQPIRSLRFPSNWHLSKDRAASVKTLLAAEVKPERMTAEGRADTEPLFDNGSAESRAKNRRVEITLFATAQN